MADARPRSLKLHMSVTVPPALVRANKRKERLSEVGDKGP